MTVAILLIIFIVLAVAITLLARWLSLIHLDIDYINMEIGRNEGSEKEYWIKEKKKYIHSLHRFHRKK